MPNFVYFATLDESIAILRDLCALGLRVIVEAAPADQPSLPVFETVTPELEALLAITPTFYLAGSYTRSPIQFMRLSDGDSAGKYVVNHLADGPIMQCRAGRLKIVRDVPKLLEGSISYQKSYKNQETGEWHGPTPELVTAFKKCVSAIKKRCVPLEKYPYAVIAPKAQKLFENNEAQID